MALMEPILPIPGFSEPVSCWSHLVGAVGFLVAGVFLLKKSWGSPLRTFSHFVYIVSLIFLFSMSGVYHLLDPSGEPREVLQRLDHAGIWALIAGTFTPIHLVLFRGLWRWPMMLLIWTFAVTGLVLEVVFFNSIPEWLTLTLYLALGWVGVVSTIHFAKVFGDKSLQGIIYGGLFYSAGALLEFMRWPVIIPGVIGPHEIFHIFVIVAAVLHFNFIYKWATFPVADSLVFHVKVFSNNSYVARSVRDSIYLEEKSISALKEKIAKQVKEHYEPKTVSHIHLKYFEEEIIFSDRSHF